MIENSKETKVTKKAAKNKMYDSVFLNLFSDKENLLDLYKTLIGKELRADITEDDISLLDSESTLMNDLYNDLSFVVDDELIVLVEAQSTYTKNIATRLLFYLAKDLEEYIRNKYTNANIYLTLTASHFVTSKSGVHCKQ